REELIGLIAADAKFIDERDTIAEYIRSLPEGQRLNEADVRKGYETFKAERKSKALANLAAQYQLDTQALTAFVDATVRRRLLDGEALSDLLAPLELGWKARAAR